MTVPEAMRPIASPGLFNAAKGGTFESWRASGEAFPSIAPQQVDDSVSSRLGKILATDSPLMQAAKTEGLKMANSRGLLNSSLAAGATQRAMLDAALPVASQDASQDFGRNQAARSFEYGMAAQDSSQRFAGDQAGLDRTLQRDLQRGAQDFAGTQAGLDRDLSRQMQQNEITYQSGERALDRGLQETLASWNLASSDRNAAAQFLTNMESMYQNMYSSILGNPNLSAGDRTTYFAAAKAMRDIQLNLVEQFYNIDLKWGTTMTVPATSGATTTSGVSDLRRPFNG